MKRNTIAILNDIKNNIIQIIDGANQNSDCKGFDIIFGNYSINIPSEDQNEFWEELEEMQDANECYFMINDYNDLCIQTSEYVSEYD